MNAGKETHSLKALKLLLIIPGRPDGNELPFARRQARHFADRYHADVRIFFLRDRTSLNAIRHAGHAFRSIESEFKPDVVHVHYGSMTAFFGVIHARAPVVITFHGSDLNPTPTDGRLRDLFGRIMSQLAALFASGIICVSRKLVERLWWRRGRAKVLPMGVDLDGFTPMDREECRKALGWDPDEKVILFNGNNPSLKRLDLAEQVIDGLVRRNVPVRLEVLKGEIQPTRMPVIMNAADALLLCSDQEGSPTMVKEAMACGLPVVSSDVGDVRERTRGVFPGAVVEQDVKRLTDALGSVLQLDRRSNGREKAVENGIDAAQIDLATYQFLCDVASRK